MQSYRNRRMKPESKCCGQTVHVQAVQEPTVQTLNLVATNGPCLASTNRVQFEEPEEFKLLTETCPMVFPYMPSIQRRKAHQKPVAEHKVPHTYSSRRFARRSSIFSWLVLRPFLAVWHDLVLRANVPFLDGGIPRASSVPSVSCGSPPPLLSVPPVVSSMGEGGTRVGRIGR